MNLMDTLRPLITLLLVSNLCGCATSYDPNKHYDPNAIEKLGRIINKTLVRHETRLAADSKLVMRPEMYGLPANATTYATAFIMQELFKKEAQIPIYAYSIHTEDETNIVVFSEFPAHDVGACVKVFLSSRPDYPRMTGWSGCKA